MGQHVREFTDAAASWPATEHDARDVTRNAALVVDTDRSLTRAMLFDLVEGTARFVAASATHSTAMPPLGDPSIGLGLALRDLEAQTGRRLVESDQLIRPQRLDGDGVDMALATGMPAPPIRVALISVGRPTLSRVLVGAARRATTLLADSEDEVPPGGDGFSPAALESWLRSVRPSTIVLVFDSGSPDEWGVVVDAIRGVAEEAEIRQGIVVADEPRQQSAAAALGGTMDLSGIDPADYDVREIAAALESELREQYSRAVDEPASLRLLSNATFVDRVQASQSVVAFLHRRMGRNVVAVTSSEGSLLVGALRSGGTAVLRSEMDLGLGIRALLRIPAERVLRWLPYRSSAEEITQWVLNRALRPFTEFDSSADAILAAAFSRELLAMLAAEAGLADRPDVDLIAAGAGFAWNDPVLTLLTLLDGIRPNPKDGLVSIAQDTDGLIAAIGALAAEYPTYAREVIEQDFLTPLASCVVINGQGAEGALAVRGEIRFAGGEVQRFSVPYGNMHRIPLGEGAGASLTLEPEPGFAVGGRESGEVARFVDEHQVFGGELGVVIDARGRPLALPDDVELRVSRLKSWIVDLGGHAD